MAEPAYALTVDTKSLEPFIERASAFAAVLVFFVWLFIEHARQTGGVYELSISTLEP